MAVLIFRFSSAQLTRSTMQFPLVAKFTIEAIAPDKVKVSVEGKHDGFPDYEAVVNGIVPPIYERKSPSSGPSIWNLGGGPEVPFSRSVTLDLKTPNVLWRNL